MRIPGLGGEVLKRAGGTPVTLPGGELFTALQSGTIDATEWIGPHNDLAFGFHKTAKYHYYPGFHEPGGTLEVIINKAVFETLPADLKSIVLNACKVLNQDLLAEYTARNPIALQALLEKHGVALRAHPDDVLVKLHRLAEEVVSELAERDAFSRKVYTSCRKFLRQAKKWSNIFRARLSAGTRLADNLRHKPTPVYLLYGDEPLRLGEVAAVVRDKSALRDSRNGSYRSTNRDSIGAVSRPRLWRAPCSPSFRQGFPKSRAMDGNDRGTLNHYPRLCLSSDDYPVVLTDSPCLPQNL